MREIDAIAGQVIGAAIRVHKKFGPGLLESVYKPVLGHELVGEGLQVEIEKPLSVEHEDLKINRAYILDLLVEDQVIIEVKCVKRIEPVHTAQVLTYLRLTGLELGLILNFKTTRLIDGIKRVVNNYQEERDDL
jgi:GxxExxY protein